MAKITKNFTTNEMKCPCCDKCEMDEGFMISLQDIRSRCGFGFRVNSAYRCKEYNNKSGWWLSVSGWFPEIISLCVGVATLIYLVIKISKELK